jgi:formylglycine-generating enzyme required for sulfatase activity
LLYLLQQAVNDFEKFAPRLNMLWIDGGEMQAGSTNFEFKAMPVQKIQLQAFAISDKEISFEQYDIFTKITGRPSAHDHGYGRGQRPVIHLTFEDAVAYTQWLSAQTGQNFRLPSEMEWLWAATNGMALEHAMTQSARCTSANLSLEDCLYEKGAPQKVGSYPAGNNKLFDMTGNVWEWTQDCYNSTFPINLGQKPTKLGDCQRRMVKGGSWTSDRILANVQMRQSFPKDRHDLDIGFRIVLDLNQQKKVPQSAFD